MIDFEKFSKLVIKIEELKAFNKLIRLGYIKIIDVSKPINFENVEFTIKGNLFLLNQKQDYDLTWVTTEYRQKFKIKNISKFGDKKSCEVKMSQFMDEYQASKEEILKAVDLYFESLQDFSNSSMARADYFISYDNGKKDGVISKLSQYLELVREGHKTEEIKWL